MLFSLRAGSEFEVIAGAHDVKNPDEPSQQRVVTRKKLVHWGYADDGHVSNDIALLWLPRPLFLSKRSSM